MGRKGVSKRKPKQEKSKPMSAGAASGSVASAMQAVESQPANQKKTPKKG